MSEFSYLLKKKRDKFADVSSGCLLFMSLLLSLVIFVGLRDLSRLAGLWPYVILGALTFTTEGLQCDKLERGLT